MEKDTPDSKNMDMYEARNAKNIILENALYLSYGTIQLSGVVPVY